MKELNILKLVQLHLTKFNCVLFRNNTGKAWQGKRSNVKIEGDNNAILLKSSRIVHFGLCEGSSDLIGWTIVKVTPEMIGKKIAVFTAIETKSKTKATKEQLNFIRNVKQAGGYAGIATDPETALNLISQLPGLQF